MNTKKIILLLLVAFPLWGYSQKKDTIIQYSYCADGVRVSFALPWHYRDNYLPHNDYWACLPYDDCCSIRYRSHAFCSFKYDCSMFTVRVYPVDSVSESEFETDEHMIERFKDFCPCPEPIIPTIKRVSDSNSMRVLSFGSTVFEFDIDKKLEPSQRHSVFSVYECVILLRNARKEMYVFEFHSHDKISEYSAEEKMKIMESIKVEYVGENP